MFRFTIPLHNHTDEKAVKDVNIFHVSNNRPTGGGKVERSAKRDRRYLRSVAGYIKTGAARRANEDSDDSLSHASEDDNNTKEKLRQKEISSLSNKTPNQMIERREVKRDSSSS